MGKELIEVPEDKVGKVKSYLQGLGIAFMGGSSKKTEADDEEADAEASEHRLQIEAKDKLVGSLETRNAVLEAQLAKLKAEALEAKTQFEAELDRHLKSLTAKDKSLEEKETLIAGLQGREATAKQTPDATADATENDEILNMNFAHNQTAFAKKKIKP